MRMILVGVVLVASCFCVAAQETVVEKRVALTEQAIALDGAGAPALEATLKSTGLNGAEDSPVTNIRMVVRNAGTIPYAFVSGLVTFYDGSGIRCGEGLFKANSLSVDEAFETDAPGIRIRCAPASWRIVANSLVPRTMPNATTSSLTTPTRSNLNLVIAVDGEEHPIQLDKPMVLKFGNDERTIVLRQAP